MAYEANGWNGNASGPIHFTNVRILDGTGEYPYTGEVLIQGNRIKQVTRGSSRLGPTATHGGATVIDGMGATLMPGMIDAHLHLSWNNAPGIDPIQMMELEEHMLVTMEMAKLVLDAGFTAGRGAAAAKPRLDVVAKRFINEGRFPGPRYLAAGPEITTVGGFGNSAPPIFRTRVLTLGLLYRGRRKCAARCVSSSNTASIPLSSIFQERRSRAWALKKRRCPTKKWPWRLKKRSVGTRCFPLTPARPDPSNSASVTASRTSTMRRSPTKRRWTCSRRTKTSTSSPPASPGSSTRHATPNPGD